MKRIPLSVTGIIIASAAIFAFFLGLVIAGVITPRLSSQPQTQPLPLVNEKGESPFVAVAERVMPAVVNISAERVVKVESPFAPFEFHFRGPFEDFFKEFEKEFRIPKSFKQTVKSLGSGVIFDKRGYILTNNHVIRGAENIIIKLPDKTEYRGKKVKIVGKDPITDVAVLKIEDHREFPTAPLGNSDEIKVGDWAIAIGNPFGLENSVTVGVISAKERTGIPLPEGPSIQNFLQTDAAINPGNSGGPLINIRGEVIGINTAITTRTGGNEGIGFAIPINIAKNVAEQLIKKGKVSRGWLGVYISDITPTLKEDWNLSTNEGAFVRSVIKGSPADKAGIEPGDVIVEVDGHKIKGTGDLMEKIASKEAGTRVRVVALRGKSRVEFKIKLGERPTELAKMVSKEVERWLGLKVKNLTKRRKEELGIEGGVEVVSVKKGSPAYKAGIEPGDVILKIEHQRVKDLDDYLRIKNELRGSKKPLMFEVRRGNMTIFVAVPTK